MDFPTACFPDVDRPVIATGGQEPAVGADGQAGEPAALAADGSGQPDIAIRQPAGQVPGLDVVGGAVCRRDVGVAARGVEAAAVGAERHSGDADVGVGQGQQVVVDEAVQVVPFPVTQL